MQQSYSPKLVINNAQKQRSAKNCITKRLRTAGLCDHAINEAVEYAMHLMQKGTPLFTSIHQAVTTAKREFGNYTGPFAA